MACCPASSSATVAIPDEQSRFRIELLHDLRNLLAHGKACSIDKVVEFILIGDLFLQDYLDM